MIDLRSDTVTHPTDEMRKASMEAKVGDDVFGDDPTVNELENYAAGLLGKEAALFVTSGTQGNLVSVMTHTSPGDEIILESQSHIYYYEVGGLSAIAGAIPRPFISERGYLEGEELTKYIRGENIHYPNPRLLCLENTHNRHGGVALTPTQIADMADSAQAKGLKVHLDGARIFNAVIANECSILDYTKSVDSIQICLSKGLSAPVGSILAGDTEFIKKARKKRKMVGGGMRQAGIIAAPGLLALQTMRERLKEDHANAKRLERGLSNLGIPVKPADTNIVVCDISSLFSSSNEAVDNLYQYDIQAVPFGDELVRFTTHRHITTEMIDSVLETIEKQWIK